MPDYGEGVNPQNEIVLAGPKVEYCETLAGEVTAGSFTNIGYTDKEAGGTLVDAPPEFQEVFVTGLVDPVKRKGTKKNVTFKFRFNQVNLTNLAIATGQALSQKSGEILLGGKVQDAPLYKWRFVVPNDDDSTKDITVIIPRGRVIETSEVKFSDTAPTGVDVTIQALEVVASGITLNAAQLAGYRWVAFRS